MGGKQEGYFVCAPTRMSELTFVTPSVSSASAMARPTWLADWAVPFRVTSPLCACTSRFSEDSWLSACSLFLIIVVITESSMLPVGAPAPSWRVRTIVAWRSRSDWMSDGDSRHCVILLLTSVEATAELVLPVSLVLPVALAAPVLVDSLLA